jgi:biotin operon repressor
MGYRAVNAVLYHSQAVGTTKLVLVAIATFHDDKGVNGAYPSQELIASIANCSVRTVHRAIKELQELGELEVLVHRGKGKTFDRQTNLYFVVLDCPPGCDSSYNHRNILDTYGKGTGHMRQTNRTSWADLPDTYDRLTVINNKEQSNKVIEPPRLVAVNE